MKQITSVECMGGYRLRLTFDDGVAGEVDMSKEVTFDGVFAPMKDMGYFRRVKVNRTWGTIEWPGKIDLDPEVLYESVTGERVAWASEEVELHVA